MQQDLGAFIADALRLPTDHSDVTLCVARCEAEFARDTATLAAAWDEVKPVLPGAARHRIGMALAAMAPPSPPPSPPDALNEIDSEGSTISAGNWIRGILATVLLIVGPIVLGVLAWDQSSSSSYPVNLWAYAWGPLLLVGLGEVLLASKLAPRIGWDMIEQSSEECVPMWLQTPGWN